jgi:hypothetical protein
VTPGNHLVQAAANSEAITYDMVICYSFVDRYLTLYICNSTVRDPAFYSSICKLCQSNVIFTNYSLPSSNYLIICVVTTKHELLIRAWQSSLIHQCTRRLHTESCHLNFRNLRQIAFVKSLEHGSLICRDSCCYPNVVCCNLVFELGASVK